MALLLGANAVHPGFAVLSDTFCFSAQSLRCTVGSTLLLAACHELRNPLHAIMATLTFLMDDSTLTEEQFNDIEVIFTCASHMQRLVNDVLDVAKLREGSLKIQAVQVLS